MSNKYFWLKLKRDFFKRHDIRIIEEMPNGKEYILFYLKLLVESIDHEGELRFSDTVPYNEQMLSVITNTNIDIVRSAMKVFIQLKMIDILDDETIFMAEVQSMIGGETKWAEKKRIQRKKDNVPLLSPKCPTELEIDKDIDKEKEIKKETSLSLLKRLAPEYSFEPEDALYAKIEEWVRYKMERREPYKEQGMKALLRQIQNNAMTYGDMALCELIDESMSNGWKGIIFDRLKKPQVRNQRQDAIANRVSNVDNW